MNFVAKLLGTAVSTTGWSPANIKRAFLGAVGLVLVVAITILWFSLASANGRVAERDVTIGKYVVKLDASNASVTRLQGHINDQNAKILALQVDGNKRIAEGKAAAALVDARDDDIAALKRSAARNPTSTTCPTSDAFRAAAGKGI